MSGITIYGFDKFERKARRMISNYPERKKKQLIKMGRILQGEIKKQITATNAVDTGRLRSSIMVEPISDTEVKVGTNVEYAKWVNDGHFQYVRFVPGVWRANGTFSYIPEHDSGMMLTDRWVEGKHFFEKGINSAKPKLINSLKSFMDELREEWES